MLGILLSSWFTGLNNYIPQMLLILPTTLFEKQNRGAKSPNIRLRNFIFHHTLPLNMKYKPVSKVRFNQTTDACEKKEYLSPFFKHPVG